MIVERSEENPVLRPNLRRSWEAEAVFNGCPVRKGSQILLVYRAVSMPHYHALTQTKMRISHVGVAESRDGVHFSRRRRFISPEYSWERFGCEDPRVTRLDGKYFIFYTALSVYPFQKEGIRVGLAVSPDLRTLREKHLVTPFNAKAMALFPERVNGKLMAVLTVHTDQPPARICLASFEEEKEIWDENRWQPWYKDFEKHALPLQRREHDHVEAGAPPVKTKHGWLLLYSYIQNYPSAERLFGIEAALLDLKDPSRIVARTRSPLLVPEEHYERYGWVPNVIFPSGALTEGDSIHLYYGAADTVCCRASIQAPAFLERMLRGKIEAAHFVRAKQNPILTPLPAHAWEAKAVFNPAAIRLGGRIHLLYRAMSNDNTSVLGYATSRNGLEFDERSPEPVYVPREPFEQKLVPGGNSGCEDPRLTRIGNKITMCYTAFDGKNAPRVAFTWISVKNFLNREWEWARPVLISPPDLDNKDACLFPEKIMGKYLFIHRSGDDMDLGWSRDLHFTGTTWLEEYRWIGPRRGTWDSRKVGAAAPPFRTPKGWVLLYHGVSDYGIYRVGAVLLHPENPFDVLARTDDPIFAPKTPYEQIGQVPHVVFPCGAVVLGETLVIYYGGADQVVGAATMEVAKLIKALS